MGFRGAGGAGGPPRARRATRRTRVLKGVELKYYNRKDDGDVLTLTMDNNDPSCAPSLATTTSSAFCLNGMTVGANSNQRVGSRISMKNWNVHGTLTRTSGAVSTPDNDVRIVVFWDKQNNGSVTGATYSDVFLTSTNSYNAQPNLDNRARFQILADKKFRISSWIAGTSTGDGRLPIQFRMGGSLKGKQVTYNTNLSTGVGDNVGSIKTGALVVMGISTNPIATNNLLCTLNTRIRYYDA